jgi:hypothetical protein
VSKKAIHFSADDEQRMCHDPNFRNKTLLPLRSNIFPSSSLMALQPLWALASFQFPDLFTIGRTPWTSDQVVARPLPKHRTAQTQNKRIYTPKIHALSGIRTHDHSIRASEDSSCLRSRGYRDRLASERAKTVHALGRSATVTGALQHTCPQFSLRSHFGWFQQLLISWERWKQMWSQGSGDLYNSEIQFSELAEYNLCILYNTSM